MSARTSAPQPSPAALAAQQEALRAQLAAIERELNLHPPTPSHELPVTGLDITLLMPFAFWHHEPHASDHDEHHPHADLHNPWHRIQGVIEAMTYEDSPWQERRERIPRYPSVDNPGALPLEAMREYSEFVYFHPFARNFLYTTRDDMRFAAKHDQPEANRNMRVLERRDLQSIHFKWYDDMLGEQSISFACNQCQMHLFDTGIGILSVHLMLPENSPPLTLRHTLSVLDYLRRIYAPYWGTGEYGTSSGRCGDECTFEFAQKDTGTAEDSGTKANQCTSNLGRSKSDEDAQSPGRAAIFDQIRNVHENREPSTATTWSKLLQPLTPRTFVRLPVHDTGYQFKHILDERLQVMARVEVDGVQSITAADWMRLANVDDAGDSTKYPYSPAFLNSGNFTSMTYDRYWDPRQTPEADPRYCRTRWLSCGYHLTAVGDSSDAFFKDPQSGLLAHFRHHYFKLYMIAQLQIAAILNYKQRIQNAWNDLRWPTTLEHDKDHEFQLAREQEFCRAMLAIEADFLHFRSTYWFPDITNQIQGQEMFALITSHLRTEQWFNMVQEEIRGATARIQSREMVASVQTIKHMQVNVEWVELFIVAVYAVELPYAFGHIWELKNSVYRIGCTVMAIVTIALFAALTRPWAHPGQKFRRLLLVSIMIAWALLLAAAVWYQGPARAPSSADGRGSNTEATAH